MATHAAKAFTDQILQVDGQRFVDCKFKKVLLVYSGGAVPHFESCNFETCQWEMRGAALRTVDFLGYLYGAGHHDLLDKLTQRFAGKSEQAH